MMVDNIEKLQFLDNYTSTHNIYRIWIGLDDMATESVYMWSDQTQANMSEILTLFIQGEPNNDLGIEDCVEFRRKSKSASGLNDTPCDYYRPFICEHVV
ncbi:unnamed protein product [Lymnaea stagnalis]|uniref:C-type lectin domain-containing protein n=1 Tax=Lymnaea stagnalis TaxID=6523 RepID=A0AAV2HN96_LYMST